MWNNYFYKNEQEVREQKMRAKILTNKLPIVVFGCLKPQHIVFFPFLIKIV